MKKLTILVVLGLLVFLNACAMEIEDESIEDPFEDCDQIIYHNTEYSTSGVYVSKEGDSYQVTIDYENQDDFFEKDLLSARDIGMLAYFSYGVYAKKGYPNADLVKEKLQNIFVVVTNTERELARLYIPNLYNIDQKEAMEKVKKIGAFVHSEKPKCFADIPEGIDISYFIRNNNLLTPHTSVHELMHPVGWWGFGDQDGDHDDERLWVELNDNSIAADVLRLWEHTNGL